MPPVWPRLLPACPGRVPPCGHWQEHPCWVLGRTTSSFCWCSAGLCPQATQTSDALSRGRGRCGVPGLRQPVHCDALLSSQIHSGTLPASPSAWIPVSNSCRLAAPELLGGSGRRPWQPLSPGLPLLRGQVPEGRRYFTKAAGGHHSHTLLPGPGGPDQLGDGESQPCLQPPLPSATLG